MSSKVKRRQVIRKAMAGLLSLAMAVTMITPAGSTVYASTLDDEKLTTVEARKNRSRSGSGSPCRTTPQKYPKSPKLPKWKSLRQRKIRQ